MATNSQFGDLLGITPTSDFHLTEIVEGGLPLAALNLLRERGLTATELADIVISPRTLKHRKARNEPLSQEETDRAVRLADRTPLNLLHTESGGRLVESMLWQLDEGIYT